MTPPTKGTVVIDDPNTGSYIYTPFPNQIGADSFTFKTNDGTQDSFDGLVDVTIFPVNDPPVVMSDAIVVDEDGSVSGTFVAADDDGDAFTFRIATPPTKGVVTFDAVTGAYTYTPFPDATGQDAFTVEAVDLIAASIPATIDVTINAFNDAPVATATTFTTPEEVPFSGLLPGSDVDGDVLTFTLVGQPTKGGLSLDDVNTGAFTYTPANNETGTDTFTFKVGDGLLESATVTVTIEIGGTNDAPVAQTQTLLTDEDQQFNGTLVAVDSDSAALTYTIETPATSGQVVITNPSTGDFTYTPDPDTNGQDTFTFKANDGQDDSNVALVTIDVTAVNDAPVAAASIAAGDEDTDITGVLAGADVDSAALTFSIVDQPLSGDVRLDDPATGAFTYTPDPDFNGQDTFTFKVSDGQLESSTVSVSVTVDPANDAPSALASSLNVTEETPRLATLQGADIDGDALTYTIVSQPALGDVTLDDPATGAFTYTPDADETGADSFTFRVNDGQLDSADATVSITIGNVNDLPVAASLTFATNEDVALSETLPVNDVDNDPLTFEIVTIPGRGAITLDAATGAFVYTPTADYNGQDTFTYRASDALGSSNLGTITVSIAPVNDLPVANDVTLTTAEERLLFDVLPGDDVDNDPVTYTLVTQPSKGILTLDNAALGTFSYTPNANETGADSFTYSLNDGQGDSTSAP